MYNYFDTLGFEIKSWKLKGLFNEKNSSFTNSNGVVPKIVYDNARIKVKFNGNLLKQNKVIYNHGSIVNVCIVYEINRNYNISTYPTLENCLFGAASLTKNADIDKYKYSGYGIGFDGEFSFGSRGFGRNLITFGADMSSSVHVNNKKKYSCTR